MEVDPIVREAGIEHHSKLAVANKRSLVPLPGQLLPHKIVTGHKDRPVGMIGYEQIVHSWVLCKGCCRRKENKGFSFVKR